MPKTDQSILVEAPIEKVFAFVADYRNALKYERHFSRLEPLPGPKYGLGTTIDARGWFRGIPVRSRLRIVEFVENQRIVSRSMSGLKSSLEWDFAHESGSTRVRLVATYGWPFPLIPHQVKQAIEAEISSMTTASLRELKRLVESYGATTG